MKLSGWGNYPITDTNHLSYADENTLRQLLSVKEDLVAFGNGRSYGDSALAKNTVKVRPHNYFINFDESRGLLTVEAGVLLSEIIDSFAPRGWFLKIVPGTKLITVGGAISSDVHGKNHHVEGCFSESVESFRLMLANGEIVDCDRNNHRELFLATCGGMGLTGIILSAKLYLKKIDSNRILQRTIKTKNLAETFEAFEANKSVRYSVAWIDCLAKESSLGRCLLNLGEFSNDNVYDYHEKRKLEIPFYFPKFSLNSFSVKAFNWLYYQNAPRRVNEQKVGIDKFFFPLDAIGHWNRIYGRKGFVQYQFILPVEKSFEGIKKILSIISLSGKGSFLAVLKLYGKENDNYLSFPLEGYSLALDFKVEPGLWKLLRKLDEIVVDLGGRLYLAKDARMSKAVFDAGYPKANEFRKLREKYALKQTFNSLQSKRLEL